MSRKREAPTQGVEITETPTQGVEITEISQEVELNEISQEVVIPYISQVRKKKRKYIPSMNTLQNFILQEPCLRIPEFHTRNEKGYIHIYCTYCNKLLSGEKIQS